MGWWEERNGLADGYASIWRTPTGVIRISAIAGAAAALHLVGVLLFGRSGLPFALATPFVAVFGPAGGWGAVLGTVVGEFALGRVGFPVLFDAFGVFLTATVGLALWLRLAYPYRKGPLTAAVAIVPVTVVAALLGTVATLATMSLGVERGFVAPAPGVMAETLLLAGVLGPPVVAVGIEQGEVPVTGMTIEPIQWLRTTGLVGAIAIGWLASAGAIDMLRTDVRARPHLREAIPRRLPPLVDVAAVYAMGPWGWTIQVAIAAAAIGLVALAISTTQRRGGPLPVPRRVRS